MGGVTPDVTFTYAWNSAQNEYQPTDVEAYEIMPWMEDGSVIKIVIQDNGHEFILDYEAGNYSGTGTVIDNGVTYNYEMNYAYNLSRYPDHKGEMIYIVRTN